MHFFILLNEDAVLLVTLINEIHVAIRKRTKNIEEYVIALKLFS